MNINNSPCPCQSGKKYKKCCRRFLEQGILPDSPEKLMRSRYTAYSLCMVDYIIETSADIIHPEEANIQTMEQWRASIELFCKHTSFEGLEIVSTSVDGAQGRVEFIATLTQGGRDASFKEDSAFILKDDGRWYYSGVESKEDLGE